MQSDQATAVPKTTRLKELILAPELLVMPGAYDPISAKLIEQAGFKAIQCSGLAISASHLGLPDYSMLSMTDMVDRTRRIVEAVDLPVMADGDTGFGNAVNAYYAIQAFERAGAAGVNIEDQVMPKRCGHLEGKQVVPLDEAVAKIRACVDARRDQDFVINARTDALSPLGMDEAIRRANAYLEAGATMAFLDGIASREQIVAAVAGIRGPVAVNLVEGGKSPLDVTLGDLQAMGVARVSLPGTLMRAAVRGMQMALERVRETGDLRTLRDIIVPATVTQGLMGMRDIEAMERKYLAPLMANKPS